MNRVMARSNRQRGLTLNGKPPDQQKAPTWRLFQLAFILLNLDGLVDPAHPDRPIVDLLFFPTGGGKTEAYLGLAAFAIARRRLNNPGPRGRGPFGRHALHAAASDARSASARCRPHLRARTRTKSAAGTAWDLANRNRALGRRRGDAQQSRQREEPQRKHRRLTGWSSIAREAGRPRRRSKTAPGAAPSSKKDSFRLHPDGGAATAARHSLRQHRRLRVLRRQIACRSSSSTRKSIAACRHS